MSTGDVERWSGTIADIGLIYPFVGIEGLLVIVALVLWIAWHGVDSHYAGILCAHSGVNSHGEREAKGIQSIFCISLIGQSMRGVCIQKSVHSVNNMLR